MNFDESLQKYKPIIESDPTFIEQLKKYLMVKNSQVFDATQGSANKFAFTGFAVEGVYVGVRSAKNNFIREVSRNVYEQYCLTATLNDSQYITTRFVVPVFYPHQTYPDEVEEGYWALLVEDFSRDCTVDLERQQSSDLLVEKDGDISYKVDLDDFYNAELRSFKYMTIENAIDLRVKE